MSRHALWSLGCAAVLMLLGCTHGRSQTWSATVVHVTDGDTLYIRTASQPSSVAVRLLGIDAPEICQTGGLASRQALSDLVLHQQVTVVAVGQDSFGRELARVYVHGQDVARYLVSQGQAWSYRRGQDAGPYATEQREARRQRRGLFAQARAEPPNQFRQRHGPCR